MLTIQQIQQTVSDYFKDKPVKKVYLFGSYARNEADDESDVDLLVDLDLSSMKSGLDFFTWYEDIGKVLKVKVDVLSEGGVSKYIQPYIEEDKVLIYEK